MKFRLGLKDGYVSWFPIAKEKGKTVKLLLWLLGIAGLFVALAGTVLIGLGWGPHAVVELIGTR